jgi:hypothetical protein
LPDDLNSQDEIDNFNLTQVSGSDKKPMSWNFKEEETQGKAIIK